MTPMPGAVIVHVIVEMATKPTVTETDELLKPVLDALRGVAWKDEAQVYEVLCRRLPGPRRQGPRWTGESRTTTSSPSWPTR